jgi:alpha-L-arabinofuranosidase
LTLVSLKRNQGGTIDSPTKDAYDFSHLSAQILHDPDFNACNTFENPDRIVPRSHPVTVEGSRVRLDLPMPSVATVTLRIGENRVS